MNISVCAIAADITQANLMDSQIRAAEIQLGRLRNEQDALYFSLRDKVKRVL